MDSSVASPLDFAACEVPLQRIACGAVWMQVPMQLRNKLPFRRLFSRPNRAAWLKILSRIVAVVGRYAPLSLVILSDYTTPGSAT